MLTRIVCHGVPISLATIVHGYDDARTIVMRSIVPERSRVIHLDRFVLN